MPSISATDTNLIYDWIKAEDLEDAIKIEEQGYPQDEAATLEAFRYRQSQAPHLFLGAFTNAQPRELIGYICSTLSPSSSLSHQSMSTHVPASSSVCVHSVCVSPSHRRKGVGLGLLNEYLTRLENARREERYERVLLITHEELRQFYAKAGFEWVGKSEVNHGSRPWYEMRKDLGTDSAVPSPETTDSQQTLPPGLWEALQRPSSHSSSTTRSFSSFPNGVIDLTDTATSSNANKFDILCPRPGCGSIILKNGVGKFVDRTANDAQAELENHPHPLLPTISTQWWLITPSPMEFENIGFSRPVQAHREGKKLKLLACAECDLGPLGWSEEGGSEFWLACERVGYRG